MLSLALLFSGSTFFKIRNKVEKYKRDWIKTRYQYELLKSHTPLPLPSKKFPAQNLTQSLDHFDPEIEASLVRNYPTIMPPNVNI